MLKAHLLWTFLLGIFLVSNIEWEKPTAHAAFSYIDSRGYASGQIQ